MTSNVKGAAERAEEAKRAAERRLRRAPMLNLETLMQLMPVHAALYDPVRECYEYWNREPGPGGYTMKEWNALPPQARRSLIHPDDLARVDNLSAVWDEEGRQEPLRLVYRLRHRDGAYRWLDVTLYRDRTYDGIPVQVELTLDVTGERESGPEVRRKAELYDLITSLQGELVMVTTPGGEVTYASPSVCAVFGVEEEEILGKVWRPEVHEDDRETSVRAREGVLQPPYECYYEEQCETPGGWRWVAWSHKALRSETGAVTAVVGIGRDITALKRMEAAGRRSREDLLRVFENLDSPVAIFSPEGEIWFMNSAFLSRLRFTARHMARKDLADLIDEEGRAEFDWAWEEVRRGKVCSVEVLWRDRRGRGHSLRVTLSPGRWNERNAVFLFGLGSQADKGRTKP